MAKPEEKKETFAGFDSRMFFYKAIYRHIELFENAYVANRNYYALSHLENWHGMLEPYIKKDKNSKKLNDHWKYWHGWLIYYHTVYHNNWVLGEDGTWYNHSGEKKFTNTDTATVEVRNRKGNLTPYEAEISREDLMQQIRLCLRKLSKMLWDVMDRRKMNLPEKTVKKHGKELGDEKYG